MLEISDYTEGELWLILRQQRLQLTGERDKLIDEINKNTARVEVIDAPGYTDRDRGKLNRKRNEIRSRMRKDMREIQKIERRLAELDVGEDLLEGGL
jgi:hypothetical protein